MRISKPLVLATSFFGLIAASLIQSSTMPLQAGSIAFPRQECKSDGAAGCPNINNCPVPGGNTYYCRRAEGPDSKSCQGTSLDQCYGAQNFFCGSQLFCGTNQSTGDYWYTNPNGTGYWTPNVCSQLVNKCNLIP